MKNDHVIEDGLRTGNGWLRSITARLDGYPDPHACWEWRGSVQSTGYAQVQINGRRVVVHRIIWIALVGPIGAGLVLDHDGPSGCHNRRCANPEHLQAVTPRHNTVVTGSGFAAMNARRETCPRGHPLVGENLRPAGLRRGRRDCRICHHPSGRVPV